jgi:hypothetical protein
MLANEYFFSTKAGTLAQLQGKLKNALVAPLVHFTVKDWQVNRNLCIKNVLSGLGGVTLIVRSSRQNEDLLNQSNAGAFLTLSNVSSENLESAVERVLLSYGNIDTSDQILIQPMLQNVIRSGVGFSVDPNNGAPYRIINWSEGADTSKVTGGQGGRTWQGAAMSPFKPPPNLVGIVDLIEELLTLFGNTPLDCEFAVTSVQKNSIKNPKIKEQIWLLQVRPLHVKCPIESSETQAKRLLLIAKKVELSFRPHPFLVGRSTVFGVMPDWNPAEIIGIRPKPLALSLYRELVTDAIWAYQRNNYGYRNLRSFPLMPHFFGQPYIDVRVSFNSFIPFTLDDSLAGRLVDNYIECMLAEPNLHDKVEFDIVFSCYTLDLPQRMDRLARAGFSKNELRKITDSLRKLTNRILHPKKGIWRLDAAKIQVLSDRREALLSSDAYPLERIYWLIEDTKRYGTLPFAGLARAGFIAVQMLRSLVSVGIFSEDDHDKFMGSVSTISRQLVEDRSLLDKSTFLKKYGHLRPGTYEIGTPSYNEAPDLYFNWSQRPTPPKQLHEFKLSQNQNKAVETMLVAHGLQTDVVSLFEFMRAGIELREFTKFSFTRNLSEALLLIAAYGEQFGFSAEDMSFCDVGTLREMHVAATNPREMLSQSIASGRCRYRETLSLALPPVISKQEDVWAFESPESTPNFITQKRVTGPVAGFDKHELLSGSIICIPSADPGFDWLFAYPIAGLITAWGGVNSHMAIRANENGLPAVIGAGDILYRRWSQSNRLYIDCVGRKVEILL